MERVLELLKRITCNCLDKTFTITASYDQKYTTKLPFVEGMNGRIYLQVSYTSKCTKTGKEQEWKGRKNYLSDHMTDDEIIKTAYLTFKQAVEHEIMEGFKIDGTILFNPHINYQTLLSVSNDEIRRDDKSHLKIVR